jgi:tetratricopeptide (TPR) repeat protein
VEVYEKVIALDPSNPGDLLNLGLLHQKCKHYEKALASLQQYREKRPGDVQTDCRLAFLFEDLGRVEDGLALVRETAERSPDDRCIQFAWGRLLEKRGLDLVDAEQYDDAIAAYRQAEARFQPTLGDAQWGESAGKQLKRLDQLIKIAEAKKKQAESE